MRNITPRHGFRPRSRTDARRGATLGARFGRDSAGNVALLFAFALAPLLLAGGAALDYARDSMVRGELAAAADAAVLVATTPNMMAEPAATAKAAVTAMFAAQAGQIAGSTYNPANLTVSVSDAAASNGYSRNVSLTYSAHVAHVFGLFENMSAAGLTVTSSASSASAPNINFYLLLDASPSMEIPATTSGINAMVAKTGCALACHETNFSDSEYSTHYPGWGKIDSYTYAENAGITLRIDNVRDAAQSLVSTSNTVMAANQARYQMAAYTFSDSLTNLLAMQTTSSANISAMQNAISAITPPVMSANGTLAKGQTYTYPSGSIYKTITLAANTSNDDTGTNFAFALSSINTLMTTPGNGTAQAGDAPQGVLMIITDGVEDLTLPKGGACATGQNWSYSNSYGTFTRCQRPVDISTCAAIKARGIRIAVLYTTYYPLTSNSWYNSTIAPFISQVSGNLQNCASSSNLFFAVSTDGDITAAMKQLFLNAVTTAPHLTQ